MLKIDEARNALKKGKIIVYPTDTVWGMGCNPFNQESVNNLFKIKGKKENGVSILVNNVNLISKYCIINKKQEDIIEKLFPGPFTAILKSKVDCTFSILLYASALMFPKKPLATCTIANVSIIKNASDQFQIFLKLYQIEPNKKADMLKERTYFVICAVKYVKQIQSFKSICQKFIAMKGHFLVRIVRKGLKERVT